MERIEIIKDKSELEGTCYIELSLGKYQGKHWEETSLFFDEEVFGLIEPIFERNIKGYDHYGMNDANSDTWSAIISDLKELSICLSDADNFKQIVGKVSFLYSSTSDYFQNNFLSCKKQLNKMISEVVAWAEKNIVEYKHIAVLGI